MADLPEPEDAFDEKLLADIREYGWHCVLVANEHHPEHAERNAALGPHPVYDATFAYTVGLWQTHTHPEVILVGRWPQAHAILANVVSIIEEGMHFRPGIHPTRSWKALPFASGTFRRISGRSF